MLVLGCFAAAVSSPAAAKDNSEGDAEYFKKVFAQSNSGEAAVTEEQDSGAQNTNSEDVGANSGATTPGVQQDAAPTQVEPVNDGRALVKNDKIFADPNKDQHPAKCSILSADSFSFAEPVENAGWPLIHGVALGNSPTQLMEHLSRMVRKLPAARAELRQRCPWLDGPTAGRLFQAGKQSARESDIVPIFLRTGDGAGPTIPTITIEYTPCTQVIVDTRDFVQQELDAGRIRKGSVEAKEDEKLSEYTPNSFGEACIDHISIENFVHDQFAVYARYYFRESAPGSKPKGKSSGNAQCRASTNGSYGGAGGQEVHKIEWKTHWPDYEKWLYLARKDVVGSFKKVLDAGKAQRASGVWAEGNTKVRYRWLVDEKQNVSRGSFKQITEWADFKKSYCKCAAGDKKCYCRGDSDMQFVTLDVGYNPTAEVTVSKGPEYEEAWEYLRNRFVTERVYSQRRARFDDALFPTGAASAKYDPQEDPNCRLMTPVGIKKKAVNAKSAKETK